MDTRSFIMEEAHTRKPTHRLLCGGVCQVVVVCVCRSTVQRVDGWPLRPLLITRYELVVQRLEPTRHTDPPTFAPTLAHHLAQSQSANKLVASEMRNKKKQQNTHVTLDRQRD